MYSRTIFTSPPARRVKSLMRPLGLVMLLTLLTFSVSAQPQTLQYGSGTTGQINAATPLSLFIIPGLQGEIVTIDVIGLSSDFTPTASLLSPAQQPIGATSGSGGSLTVAAVLPADGNYSLLVGSLNGQPGDFAVRVDGSTTFQAFQISTGEELQGDIVPGGNPLLLSFDAAPSSLMLEIGSPFAASPDDSALRFAAQVIAANGGQLAAYDNIYGAVTLIPANAGQVFVVITGAAAEDSGRIAIRLNAAGTASSTSSTGTTPAATQTSSSTSSQPASGVCAIVAGPNGVNVRSGDGTNFAAITQIEPNGQRPAIGRNANSSWFAIDVNGATGWVSTQVVTVTGDCSSAPVLTAGSAPQPTAASVQPTATPENQVPPTATLEGQTPPTLEPTVTATPTTAVQTAPPDSNTFRFDVHRDNGGTFTEVISYPDGDTTDRIEMVVGLGQVGGEATRTVTLSLNCNGNGTQYVRFAVTNPNGQRYGCGQSITTRYSAPYGTGYYYVFMEDGGPSYVQYTLVASTQP